MRHDICASRSKKGATGSSLIIAQLETHSKVGLQEVSLQMQNFPWVWALHVNISYARLDMISINFKFTTIAYAESLIKTQSQDRHSIYIGKPSRGIKPIKTSFI